MTDFSSLNPDNGIDRKQLKQLKLRFLTLNNVRLERTREAISVRQQLFLDLLPLLLHVNHPMLPGYQGSDTPCGIPYFKPNKIQIGAANIVARSFEIKKDFLHQEPAIDAVFIMGSVGTIAHSESSDFDIWVCHKNNIKKLLLQKLEKKFNAISTWAEQELGVEAHFFPICSNTFNNNQSSDCISSESSGSAQPNLLLDEFYRSAIWIAGKVPLWWYVPVPQEKNYTHYTQQLINKRFIRKQDVIDFGPITKIPQEEYLGAGIWQLYKAIISPHKSVLKLMLLEAYAAQGQPKPLALDFKEKVFKKPPVADELDSYLLIYNRIEEYFLKTNQDHRLELARRCLYFKINKPLTRTHSSHKSWQRQLLELLVNSWGWDNFQLLKLDAHKLWKASQVIQERDLLIQELSRSYRLISNLSQQTFQNATINSGDLAILGRKLHAAFERKSGKIDKINPGISKDIGEAYLNILQTQEKPYWKLYKEKHTKTNASHLYESDSFYALLVWAIWNKILTKETCVDLAGDISLKDIEKDYLIRRIREWLPDQDASPHENFLSPAHITDIQAVINLTSSPYKKLDKQGLKFLSEQTDALNYSGLHDNLVQSVEIAHINSWHELIVRSYKDNALSDLITSYLRFAPPHLMKSPPAINIVCPDQQFGSLIENRLYELFARITHCFYGPEGNPYARYLIETHHQFYILQFQQGIPTTIRLNSTEELIQHLETPNIHHRPITLDPKALLGTPLRAIIENIKPDQSHLFYEINDNKITYTYSDASGILFQTVHQDNKPFPESLVSFISSVNARLSSQGEEFSLNHFKSLENTQHIEISQIIRRGKAYIIKKHKPSSLRKNLNFTEIKVIAEPDENLKINYIVFCDDQEYRINSFEKAASYIAKKRQGQQKYHCYISDLDLTACSDIIAPETGLQLIHYLKEKKHIEFLLNKILHKRYLSINSH